MPFNPQETISKIPTSIRSLKISFVRGYGEVTHELHGDPNEIQEVALFDDLGVGDQNKAIMSWRRGNLIPFLTPGEIAALQGLLDRLWALAETEILP